MGKLASWDELKRSEAAKWQAALPEGLKGMGPEFAVAAATLVRQNPKLLDEELFPQRLVECAALGLRPNWGPRGEAAIVPASGGVILVVGYRGYIRAYERDGLIKPGGFLLEAKMPEDEFDYFEDESGVHYRFRRNMSCVRSFERMEFVFARAYLREGGVALAFRDRQKCETVRKDVMGRIKDASKKDASAWGKWPLEMAIKGAAKEFNRSHPFGENTERIMEYEAANDPEEKDMGTAQRVDLAATRPITVSAALHEPRPAEVIEPMAEREAVLVERQATKAPGVIADESQGPDWSDEDESRIAEWEAAEGEIPDNAYRTMYASVQRMKGTIAYAALAARLKELSKRWSKKGAKNDEPGSGG